jgi:hypothetical protein
VNLRDVVCDPDGTHRFTIVWSDGHSERVHGYAPDMIGNLTWPYAGETEWTVAVEDQVLVTC